MYAWCIGSCGVWQLLVSITNVLFVVLRRVRFGLARKRRLLGNGNYCEWSKSGDLPFFLRVITVCSVIVGHY